MGGGGGLVLASYGTKLLPHHSECYPGLLLGEDVYLRLDIEPNMAVISGLKAAQCDMWASISPVVAPMTHAAKQFAAQLRR